MADADIQRAPAPSLGDRAGVLWRRLSVLLDRDLTISVLASVCVAFILTGTGSVVLAQRLAEARSASPVALLAAPVAAVQALTPLDFTLSAEELRSMTAEEARTWNNGLPFSALPIYPAAPFILPPERIEDYSRALDCLTAAVYYEAASESDEGQAAVAQVVLNRMRHPAYPSTVCGVVFQGSERTTGCQFSFTCDGAMARTPSATGWARARASASAALNGAVMAAVGTATHYHTDWVAPYWAERLTKVRQLGTHIFYRWNGGWGLPAAFTSRYGGPEPVLVKMAALSSPVEIPEPVLLTVIFEEPVEDPTLAIPMVKAAPPPITPEPEVAPTPVAAVEAPPPAVTMMADPLAQPAARPQRRSRIATPSGW